MSADAQAAVANALATSTWPGGLCLNFVRSAYGVAADGNDSNSDGVIDGIGAAQEWDSIPDAHRYSTDNPADVPYGAPVWMYSPTTAGKKYGHVAIGLGGGQMRTTAAGSTVKTVSIAAWAAKGYTVKGWSDWINDVPIDGIVSKQARHTLGSRVLMVRAMGTDVGELQRRLSALPTALPLLKDDNDYYTKTAGRVAEFEGQWGLPATGVFDAEAYAMLLEAEKPPVIPDPEPEPKPVPDPIPDPVPDPIPDPIPEPDPTPAPTPEPVPAPSTFAAMLTAVWNFILRIFNPKGTS